MQREELVNAIEAVLFAAAEPLSLSEIKGVLARALGDEAEDTRGRVLADVRSALDDLEARYRAYGMGRGFTLVRVAGAWSFRSNARFSQVVKALRCERVQRMSKAALETLAIVAYRQPVTKPEVDQIRGVDSGGTLRWLLDRGQLRIVGKREEPGRPMLYGTTKEFLSLFNIASLQDLPTLRDARELTDESRDALGQVEGLGGLAALSETVKRLQTDELATVGALDEAVGNLRSTENSAREALAREGIMLSEADADAAGVPASASEAAGDGQGAAVVVAATRKQDGVVANIAAAVAVADAQDAAASSSDSSTRA